MAVPAETQSSDRYVANALGLPDAPQVQERPVLDYNVPSRIPGVRLAPHPKIRKGRTMSFGIYLAGFLIMMCGLIYGATLLHVAPHWIVAGAIVFLGLGILKGVQSTRGKDSSQ